MYSGATFLALHTEPSFSKDVRTIRANGSCEEGILAEMPAGGASRGSKPWLLSPADLFIRGAHLQGAALGCRKLEHALGLAKIHTRQERDTVSGPCGDLQKY